MHWHDHVQEFIVADAEGTDGARAVGLRGLKDHLFLVNLAEHGDQIADVEVDLEILSFHHRIQLIFAVAHLCAAGGEMQVADTAVAVGLDLEADNVGVVAGEKLRDSHRLEEGVGADHCAGVVALGDDGAVVGGSGRRSVG